MSYEWTDVQDIAVTLSDTYPDIDPFTLSFPLLLEMIQQIPDFSPQDSHPNEKILEAIQALWAEEYESLK